MAQPIEFEIGANIAVQFMQRVHEGVDGWSLIPLEEQDDPRYASFFLHRQNIEDGKPVSVEIVLKEDGTWSAFMAIDPVPEPNR